MLFPFFHEFTLPSVALRCILALALGAVVGYERGRHRRAAGLRTHILVCLGSAVCAIVGLYTTEVLGYSNDPLRVGAQVVSGIGFLGAGTILIRRNSIVTGLTTAAGLWATASIGLAVGVGFVEIAMIATLLVMFAFFLSRFEFRTKGPEDIFSLYLELSDLDKMNETIDLLTDEYQAFEVEAIPAKSGNGQHVGVEARLDMQKTANRRALLQSVRGLPQVVYALESDYT